MQLATTRQQPIVRAWDARAGVKPSIDYCSRVSGALGSAVFVTPGFRCDRQAGESQTGGGGKGRGLCVDEWRSRGTTTTGCQRCVLPNCRRGVNDLVSKATCDIPTRDIIIRALRRKSATFFASPHVPGVDGLCVRVANDGRSIGTVCLLRGRDAVVRSAASTKLSPQPSMYYLPTATYIQNTYDPKRTVSL